MKKFERIIPRKRTEFLRKESALRVMALAVFQICTILPKVEIYSSAEPL